MESTINYFASGNYTRMSNIKVLVVEDDPIFAVDVEIVVDELGYELIGIIDNADDAIAQIRASNPDIILMDVFPKGEMNGLEIAEAVKELKVPIIFFTASKDPKLYEKAKSYGPVAYLIKPFDKITLQSTIELAFSKAAADTGERVEGWTEDIVLRDSLFIKGNNVLKKVMISEILWLQSDGNYCVIHTNDRKYILKKSLTKVVQKLPKADFIQIHRSYIIRIDSIKNINLTNNEVSVTGKILPLGRSFKDGLLEKLNLL